jgi:hypothetical protein
VIRAADALQLERSQCLASKCRHGGSARRIHVSVVPKGGSEMHISADSTFAEMTSLQTATIKN